MARKSRKSAVPSQPRNISAANDIYSTALYTRISVETERKRETDTIGNQLQLLNDYVSEHPDLSVFDIYTDDDISGVDFVRPEFSRMMNDLRDGKINCIVVKDLSRLGRNFLESGEYIELVFPFFNCRFIAITDQFDTKYQQPDFSVQLKNLANEMYAKDISKKICSAKRTVQEQGKFTSGRAPYGYLVDPNSKGHFVLDEETAPVVRELFEMISNGYTLHSAAVAMNEKGVPSPGRILYERGIAKTDKYKNSRWYMPTIRRILTDETYLGWMVSGKHRSTYLATGQKGTQKVPREEWIVVKGTHEPVVTEALFYKVQAYFAQTKEDHRNVARYNSKNNCNNIFKGHLKCGECGKSMFLHFKKNKCGEKEGWYYCAMHEHYNASYCAKKSVKKEDLECIIFKILQSQIKLFTDSQALYQVLNRSEGSKTKYRILRDQIRNTKKQVEKYMERKAALYEDFQNGIISQSDYLVMGQEYSKKADDLCIFLAELERNAKRYSSTSSPAEKWVHIIAKFSNADALSQEMIDAFVESVTLYNNGYVDVQFKFREELAELVQLTAVRKKEECWHEV